MADRIQLLPEIVANQIAAGEVVCRPASVVKEMMENAVDAGAEAITVNVRDGGRELIQVVDDGCGLSPADARLAFDRHATSKIASLEDIYALRTFGFRGEALASIAAVAQVELRTRQEGDAVGTCTTVHGGQFVDQQPVATPCGAQFVVRNLFYNTPARRRFSEKSTVSATQIKSEFQRVALCHPKVACDLFIDGAPIYRLSAAPLVQRIVDVSGRTMKQNLVEVQAATSIVGVEGYVGRPDTARKGSNPNQYFFVNGRYFRSAYLYKAVQKAYEKLIPEGAAPACFLYLTIDPAKVDVNIHPQKTEVKFADEQAVWQILHAAVREALARTGVVPLMDFDAEDLVDIPVYKAGANYTEPSAMRDSAYNPFVQGGVADGGAVGYPGFAKGDLSVDIPGGFSDVPATVDPFEQAGLEFIESGEGNSLSLDTQTADFDQITMLADGYASALYQGRFVVVSLKRALERVRFDHYAAMLTGAGASVSQQLLFPVSLEFSTDQYALLEAGEVELSALGFDLDFSGNAWVEVKGIPADLPTEGIEGAIYDLLQVLELPLDLVARRNEAIAAAMARSAASPTTRAQAQELLASLKNSLTPAGKRIWAEITADEIRAKLG